MSQRPRAHTLTGALCLAVSCANASIGATLPTVALTTGLDGFSQRSSTSGSWWGPSMGMANAHSALALDARFPASAFGRGAATGRIRYATTFQDGGPLRPELVVTATHRAGANRESGLRPSLRYHLAGVRSGAWISASGDGTLGGPAGDALRMPLIGFGAWARGHGLTLAGVLEQDTGILPAASETPPRDTSRVTGLEDGRRSSLLSPAHRIMVTTAYSTLRWESERIELESVAGVTLGSLAAPRRWAQASVAYRLSPQVALVASAGSPSPRTVAIDPGGERRAAVALRFSQSSSPAAVTTLLARAEVRDCALRSLGEGRYHVTVRAPGARHVELQGDMTQWQPMSLQAVGGDRWEGMIEMTSGVHHLSLRTDGGPWAPPPRFPTAPDGFSGSVGVVVVE